MQRPIRARRAPCRGTAATLPAAGHTVVRNPRLRHPPGSPAAHAGPDDRPGRTGEERGLLASAHPGCGPDGISTSCLGGGNRADGPGGIGLLDHDTFDVPRAWKTDRGPQWLATTPGGKRIYLTNSLYGSWDDQFYPDGVDSWLAKIDTDPHVGGGPRIDDASSPTARTFAACACTRSGSRTATPPPIPTATGKTVGRAGHCPASLRLSGTSPASQGEPGSGCDGRGRGWLSTGRAAQPRSSPDVHAGRAQQEQRHAGRGSLAGRGRSRHRGHRLRPAGFTGGVPATVTRDPTHRDAGAGRLRRACGFARAERGAGGRGVDPLYSDLLDPASPPSELGKAALWHPRISTRTSHDVIRSPTGSATYRLAGVTY